MLCAQCFKLEQILLFLNVHSNYSWVVNQSKNSSRTLKLFSCWLEMESTFDEIWNLYCKNFIESTSREDTFSISIHFLSDTHSLHWMNFGKGYAIVSKSMLLLLVFILFLCITIYEISTRNSSFSPCVSIVTNS